MPPLSNGWEIRYTDAKAFYSDISHAPFLDVYQIDYLKHSFYRAIHQSLGEAAAR